MIELFETRVYQEPLSDEVKLRVFMHAASMLERIVSGNGLEIDEDDEEVIQKNREWFLNLEQILNESFIAEGFSISKEEVFFFMLSLPELD